MNILITGASGFVGSFLCEYFTQQNHTVKKLVRSPNQVRENSYLWSPEAGEINQAAFQNTNVVIHLAGENVLGLWTQKKKNAILESRTKGTTLIAKTMAQLDNPPPLLISASAVGYYGDQGAEVLDEESAHGSGFLAKVCEQWENATIPAQDKGIRVVHLRIGIVLGRDGGPLAKMLTPFKLGIGGRLGNGKQYISWIAIDDIAGIITHCIEHSEVSGVVNATAPEPATNLELTKTLGKVLRRPTIFPVPAFPLKMLLQDMVKETLFSSARAKPKKILEHGYQFKYPELEPALRFLLEK